MHLTLPKAGVICPGGTLVSQREQATQPICPAKTSCTGAPCSRPAYKMLSLLHVPNETTVASTLCRHLPSILNHDHRRAGLLGHAETAAAPPRPHPAAGSSRPGRSAPPTCPTGSWPGRCPSRAPCPSAPAPAPQVQVMRADTAVLTHTCPWIVQAAEHESGYAESSSGTRLLDAVAPASETMLGCGVDRLVAERLDAWRQHNAAGKRCAVTSPYLRQATTRCSSVGRHARRMPHLSPLQTRALVRSCMRTCHGRDVDDARPALLSHGRRQHARQPHRRRQVQVQQFVRSIGVAWHMTVTSLLLTRQRSSSNAIVSWTTILSLKHSYSYSILNKRPSHQAPGSLPAKRTGRVIQDTHKSVTSGAPGTAACTGTQPQRHKTQQVKRLSPSSEPEYSKTPAALTRMSMVP